MNKQDAIEKVDFTLAAHDLPTYTEVLDRLEIIRDQVKRR